MGNCIGKHMAAKMGARNPNEIDLSNRHIGERALLKPSYCANASSRHKKSKEVPFVIQFDTETKEKYIRAYCEFCEQHEIAMMGMPNNTSAGGLGGAIAIGL